MERFHRTLRAEFRTDRVFADLATAQAELDAWVDEYNQRRPHSAIGMVPPIERFTPSHQPSQGPGATAPATAPVMTGWRDAPAPTG